MKKLTARIGLAGLLATTILSVAACGGGVTDAAAPESADAGTAAAFTPATSGEMTLYTWSDYFPEDLAKKFTEDTGIKLSVDYYDSNETLEAKLRASNGAGYDVVVPSDYMVQTLIGSGLLLEVDATSLPNGGNIAEGFTDVYFDEGRKYSVPYLYGTTGFMYDSAKTSAELTSWSDYFNPPPELGKAGTMSDQTEVVGAALRAVGVVPDYRHPAVLRLAPSAFYNTRDDVDHAVERLIDIMQNGAHLNWPPVETAAP